MRGPSGGSVSERELLAAMVASWNSCPFCLGAQRSRGGRGLQQEQAPGDLSRSSRATGVAVMLCGRSLTRGREGCLKRRVPLSSARWRGDSWRLCDSSVGGDDFRSLVAYVDQVGDRFEVLWLLCRDSRTTFPTLDAVMEYARAQVAEMIQVRSP